MKPKTEKNQKKTWIMRTPSNGSAVNIRNQKQKYTDHVIDQL